MFDSITFFVFVFVCGAVRSVRSVVLRIFFMKERESEELGTVGLVFVVQP